MTKRHRRHSTAMKREIVEAVGFWSWRRPGS